MIYTRAGRVSKYSSVYAIIIIMATLPTHLCSLRKKGETPVPQLAHQFRPFAERMQQAGRHTIEIQTFETYYRQLIEGQTGLIAEADIHSIESLPDAETFPTNLAETGRQALAKTILLKLNGGLGTSMGMEQAKSLLVVKTV